MAILSLDQIAKIQEIARQYEAQKAAEESQTVQNSEPEPPG